jgi:hypothetical protein
MSSVRQPAHPAIDVPLLTLDDRVEDLEKSMRFCISGVESLNIRLYKVEHILELLADTMSQLSAANRSSSFEKRLKNLEVWVPWLAQVWKWWCSYRH